MITFAYNVLSIKIRINIICRYVYVICDKINQCMDEHDLGHLFSFHIYTETWGSFTSYMGVHCSTCVNLRQNMKNVANPLEM